MVLYIYIHHIYHIYHYYGTINNVGLWLVARFAINNFWLSTLKRVQILFRGGGLTLVRNQHYPTFEKKNFPWQKPRPVIRAAGRFRVLATPGANWAARQLAAGSRAWEIHGKYGEYMGLLIWWYGFSGKFLRSMYIYIYYINIYIYRKLYDNLD